MNHEPGTIRTHVINGECIRMVWVPPCEFYYDGKESKITENGVTINIPNGFWASERHLTYTQYSQILRADSYIPLEVESQPNTIHPREEFGLSYSHSLGSLKAICQTTRLSARLSACQVSWAEAALISNILSYEEGLAPLFIGGVSLKHKSEMKSAKANAQPFQSSSFSPIDGYLDKPGWRLPTYKEIIYMNSCGRMNWSLGELDAQGYSISSIIAAVGYGNLRGISSLNLSAIHNLNLKFNRLNRRQRQKNALGLIITPNDEIIGEWCLDTSLDPTYSKQEHYIFDDMNKKQHVVNYRGVSYDDVDYSKIIGFTRPSVSQTKQTAQQQGISVRLIRNS